MSDTTSQARLALDAIGQLPDSELDLADAALQLARIDAPDADWTAARAHLSELARDAVAVAADRLGDDPSIRAGALAGLMTGRWRYAGATENYDEPANANLIQVIERKRGLPVALGILWLHCARAAGWDAFGVDFPGHFMIALPGGGSQLVLDVFDGGQPMDARAMRSLIKRVEGPKAELRPGLLQPMSARAVLLRLQNNLKLRRMNAGDFAGAAITVEDMLRIAPDYASLWREAALINQRLDHVGAALRCYQRFLALVPEGEAADRVRTAMDELRTRLN
ncbi:SirB1 family protein [Acidisphaera sp. L21]|uniref:SirB1 family protein n=1 Tax=Acidisphaera sp. L21 TaxID=1641851 RepID=UPI00131AA8AA|nr:transglutaminase-like domain-containing protein [Acidisphaera sp. L21]